MATAQKIPLLASTSDQDVSIEVDGNPYILRVLWNERFGYFALSVYAADNAPILLNIKLVKNYPVTERFRDLRLPFGDFYLVQDKGNAERPAYDDLGSNFSLYYIELDAEVSAQQVIEQVTSPTIGTIWDSGFTSYDSGSTLWDM
jgi:hypothetical protein